MVDSVASSGHHTSQILKRGVAARSVKGRHTNSHLDEVVTAYESDQMLQSILRTPRTDQRRIR